MLARTVPKLSAAQQLRLRMNPSFARNLSTSLARRSEHHPTGPYVNLPFQVHNRKRVPFGVLFWGFFGLGMGIPGFITWFHLKKSGNL